MNQLDRPRANAAIVGPMVPGIRVSTIAMGGLYPAIFRDSQRYSRWQRIAMRQQSNFPMC